MAVGPWPDRATAFVEWDCFGGLECELQSTGLSSEHGAFPMTTVPSLGSSNVSQAPM